MFAHRTQIAKLKAALDDARNKIKELEARYNSVRGLLESMVEGVITVDKDTRIISVNSSVEKIFGIAKEESEKRFFLEAIRNNDIAEIINKVLETEEIVSEELSLVWPLQRVFQVNASPISEDNKVSGCLIVIHDITEIRKLEQVRSDFVANASHELKTPLTSIKGFVETLLSGAWEDKKNSREFLEIINEHTNRLNSLVNDLLALSYLESREAQIKKEEVDLDDLLQEVLLGFKAQLKKRGIELKNELPGITVCADKEQIRQVLVNLVDNAIKFNKERGAIRIYAHDLGGRIMIIVEDSGIGIPGKDLSRIFERFYRVDKARSRQLGGTGLGLSIVKHIIELHGGEAGVESTEGLGSKFWLSLPK